MLEGYEGELRRILESKNIDIGDLIKISSKDFSYIGILMPRYEIFERNYITIKLSNGYNIGIKYDPSLEIELLSKHKKIAEELKQEKNEGDLVIIGTGGTILSRVDYRTGAVKPSFNLEDLVEVIPEAKNERIKMYELFKIFSEDMNMQSWAKIAEAIYKEMLEGAKGIIVTHGTDTMGYSSAAISFAVQNPSCPVAFVGAQRSLDRPSSDAALNLRSAYQFVLKSKYSGVFLIMHSSSSDEGCDVILGTRARKNHTSRRDAFKSINAEIVARIKGEEIIYLNTEGLKERSKTEPILMNKFEEKIFLLKTFPGMKGEIIDYLVEKGYRGILMEGTGLGHVPKGTLDSIKEAVDKGVLVALASQCIWGRVNMNVYERGRELLKIGVIGSEDMFPETAFVKLSWALGNSSSIEEAKELFLKNVAGEISNRSRFLGLQ